MALTYDELLGIAKAAVRTEGKVTGNTRAYVRRHIDWGPERIRLYQELSEYERKWQQENYTLWSK